MYKIMKNGRRFNTKTYGSYEEARKYAIKKVRGIVETQYSHLPPCTKNMLGAFVKVYPALSDAGFSIRKISL